MLETKKKMRIVDEFFVDCEERNKEIESRPL